MFSVSRYDEARMKFDHCQYTSDLTSDNELPQKTRIFATSTWEHCEYSSDSAPTESDASLPVVPASFPQEWCRDLLASSQVLSNTVLELPGTLLPLGQLHHQGHVWYPSHQACIDQLHCLHHRLCHVRQSLHLTRWFSQNVITELLQMLL